MQFKDSFKIWLTREKEISLKEALKLAEEFEIQEVYDPLGIYGPDSWFWCAAILEVLQQEDIIREFKILKKSPIKVPSKEGVIY